MPKGIALIYTSDEVISNKNTLYEGITKFAQGTWRDFKLTNQNSAAQCAKFGAGILVGSKVAGEFEAFTPLKWALKGFGPLPKEFTRSGAIQVFEFTTLERVKLVAVSAASNFILVTLAYEGGVLVGSMINQALPESTKIAIGGTINEIINESGWKELWKHPFGIGM